MWCWSKTGGVGSPFRETLPGGAGTGVHALVSGFTPSNNYVPINVGQLKNTAAPFYQRLMGVGYTTNYPWTETTADDADFAPAVLGQLKHVFEFDVSTPLSAIGLENTEDLINDLDQALELAAAIPIPVGSIEVRPVAFRPDAG